MQNNTEAFLSRPEQGGHKGFLWVDIFSNVHTAIPHKEPKITDIDPLDGVRKPFHNSEFFFQHCKLVDCYHKLPDGQEKIMLKQYLEAALINSDFGSPSQAWNFGRKRVSTFNDQAWQQINFKVMERAIFVKLNDNPLFMAELLYTAKDKRPIVQMKNDGYWGTGNDGRGANGMGKCLMAVRDAVINAEEIPAVSLN